METEEENISGTIKCGDWIYPSKTSASGVQYTIDFPVVLNLFLQKSEKKENVSRNNAIPAHLVGPRMLDVEISSTHLKIKTLRNECEEEFKMDISWSCSYNIKTLDRVLEIIGAQKLYDFSHYINRIESDQELLSIFVTSILLQHYSNDGEFILGIYFRKAFVSEIEFLGKR